MSGSVIAVADAIRTRQSFLITSHARPDGDAIGSSMALALALESLGRQTTVVFRDPVPLQYRDFPAVDRVDRVSLITQHPPEGRAHTGFVVDDQDRRHGKSIRKVVPDGAAPNTSMVPP